MIPRRFFWLLDIIALTSAFFLAYLAFPQVQPLLVGHGFLSRFPILMSAVGSPAGTLPSPDRLAWILLAMAFTVILFLEVSGNYQQLLAQTVWRILLGGALAPFAALSAIALVLYTIHDESWSRVFVFTFAMLGGIGLAGCRLLLRLYIRHRQSVGYYAKNVVLIGQTSGLEWLMRTLNRSPFNKEYRLLGYLRLAPDQLPPALNGRILPALGEPETLGDLLINWPITEVIAVWPSAGGTWLEKVVSDCDYFRVTLQVIPEALISSRLQALRVRSRAEAPPLPSVLLAPAELNSDALFFKRIFDILAAGLLLLLLSPLFLLIALAIRIITPELPTFYRWRVVGQKGVEFTGFKFTTMVVNADDLKAQLLPNNEMNGPVFKMSKDPRVTLLGQILRKYSLDELPQLWSVLKGDMSMVGPRPAFRHELERYELWHKRKLSVRPGMTCLWQVKGRNAISNFDDWVRLDLEYIDHWSLWLDFNILLRTAFVVIKGAGQ